jgi:hypothetical protein
MATAKQLAALKKGRAALKRKRNIIKKNMLGLVGKYGEQYTQFRHQPKEAIRFLRRKEGGECIAALYRSDIGDIDIVWGEVTNPIKHEGYGLSHIIDKHEATIKALGFEVEDFVPIIVQFGTFNLKRSDSQKRVYESDSFRFVVAIEQIGGNDKHWLLTAFDL